MLRRVAQTLPRRSRVAKSRRSEAPAALLFLLPFLGLFVIFRIVPTVSSLVLSLFDYNIVGDATFNGLDNYQTLASDPTFWHSLKVTIAFTAVSVPLTVGFGLLAAILVNQRLPAIGLFRTVYFLPVVTSLVLAGVVWQWIYGLDGPLNALLAAAGLGPVNWIQSSALVVPSIALVAAWNRFGFSMLIFLAGLKGIPGEYREAAMVDGAGSWTIFRRITLPHIKPQMYFVLVIETIYSFQAFDAIYVMTGGGPARGSYTLVFMIYEQGFKFFNYGYASAVGVVLFVLTLLLALVQRQLLGREES